VNYQNVRLWKI